MKSKFVLNAIIVSALLAAIDTLLTRFFGLPTTLHHFTLSLFATFLIVIVLATYVSNSTQSGVSLFAFAFTIYCAIGNINLHIEALIFGITDQAETLQITFTGILRALIETLIVVIVFGKATPKAPMTNVVKRRVFAWIGRIMAGCLIYFFIYLTAGIVLVTVYPEVAEFYGTKIPPFSLIAITQFFRGLIFIGVAYLILRTTPLSLPKSSMLIGLIFAVFGGIAPLIPPSEYMPAYVRFGHGIEVGVSNFVFGVILGYLLRKGSFRTE